MRRKGGVPTFKTDRQAANFWAAHDSTPYVRGLKETRMEVAPSLRRRVVARASSACRSRKGSGGSKQDSRSVPAVALVARPVVGPDREFEARLLPRRLEPDREGDRLEPVEVAAPGPAEAGAHDPAVLVHPLELEVHHREVPLPGRLHQAPGRHPPVLPVEAPVEIEERVVGLVERKVLRTVERRHAGAAAEEKEQR